MVITVGLLRAQTSDNGIFYLIKIRKEWFAFGFTTQLV